MSRQAQERFTNTMNAIRNHDRAGHDRHSPDRLQLLEDFFGIFAEEGHETPVPRSPVSEEESAEPSRIASHLPPPRERTLPKAVLPPPSPPGRSAFELNRPSAPAPVIPQVPPNGQAPSQEPENRVLRLPPMNDPGSVNGKAPPMKNARLLKRRRRSKVPEGYKRDGRSGGHEPNHSRSLSKVILAVVVLIAVGVSAIAGVHFYRVSIQPAAASEPNSLRSESRQPPAPVTTADRQAIYQLVTDFHLASNVDEKLPHILDADSWRERMEDHYRRHPITPLEVTLDEGLTSVELGQSVYARGTGRDEMGTPFEFYAAREGGSFRLDWPSLAGYCETSWLGFLLDQPQRAFEFRVIAEPATYFEGGYADQTRYACFRMRAAQGNQDCFAYVDETTTAGAKIRHAFSDAGLEPRHLTVTLAFEEKGRSHNQVIIRDVIRSDWLGARQ